MDCSLLCGAAGQDSNHPVSCRVLVEVSAATFMSEMCEEIL